MAIDRVYLNNLFFLFQYGGFFDEEYGYFGELPHALGDRLKEEYAGGRRPEKQAAGHAHRPRPLHRYQGARPLPRSRSAKPDDYEAAQRWLLLTDLGVVAKRGPGEVMVWVSSVRDLSQVADAQVTLISDQNQTMASGRTDGSGVWRTQDAKALAKGRPYMITIEKGDDFTFLLLDSMSVDTTGLDVGGAEAVGEGYTAFLYGERDLYRPGETAKGIALVRDGRPARAAGHARRAPPPRPAGPGAGDEAAQHRRPRARRVEARPARLLADRPPHAGAGGGREGHRPVPLPGGGVRPGPHLGRDRSARRRRSGRGRS